MSTILKALRRLEHDKQAEAARERNHDPLAPALTAAEPAPAQHPRRPLASWLAVAMVAAALGAGASYGLAAWWMSRNAVPGSLDVASGTPAAPTPPVAGTRSAAGAPTVSTEMPTSAGAAARMLARSPEAGPQPLPPSVAVPARASGVGAPPQGGRSAPPQGGRSAPTAQELLLAGAASSAPDPWESAAHAAPPPGRSRAEAARTERVITPDEPAGASSAASRGASEAASSASSGAAAAVNTTGRPPVAARPPSRPAPTPRAAAPTPTAAARGSAGTATQAPIPSRRADAATGSLDAGIPISSLPELVLPEPSPVVTPPRPAPPQRISKAAAPTRTPAPTSSASAAPTSSASAAPTSSAPAAPTSPTPSSAAASDSGGKLEIQVLKTVWHPKPERRSARVRLPDRVEVLEVHQDDVVEGYMVSEITPSSVVLARDEVEFTYRVGH